MANHVNSGYRKRTHSITLLCLFASVLLSSCASVNNKGENAATSNSSKNQTNSVDANMRELPVIPGDLADPSVIRKGNTYYATGTSSEWAPHFPLFQSSDLLHWQQTGFVFTETPAWAAASFWAPELFYWKGTYYVYYVARKKSDGISCIGVATSKDPAKGFTDRGILLEFGKEAIDPFVMEDKGNLYITWKAYGLDKRPIEILGSRLSADGLKVLGDPFMLLRDDDKQGLEGQCMVKRNGYYYILYSPGACCGRGCSYRVEAARSTSLQGPYTRYANNPLLSETDDFKCTGHGTIVTTKQGNDFYLYHAYSKTADVYTGRQAMLGRVVWNATTGWPAIEPQGAKAARLHNYRVDFSTSQLSDAWQWDFRHTKPNFKLENGLLYLSGQPTPNNKTGTVLTVRPLTGNYTIITEVANNNASLKGLVLYGDADESVGIGIVSNKLQVWEVKKDKRSVLNEQELVNAQQVQFKMNVTNGYQIHFFWRENKGEWQEMTTSGAFYNGDFLPPWDRSPRPGLLQNGTAPAAFTFFEIVYQ